MPSKTKIGRPGPFAMRSDSTTDNSARIPPSPSLSARRTRTTYLSDTIAISAQKDERDDAEHVGRQGVPGRGERNGQGVERARPDIAEHHPDRGEREEDRAALVQFAAAGGSDPRSP